MIIPKPIQPGSKIRIVSPAGKIKEKHVLPAVEWFNSQGYRVILGKHVFAQHFQFAGTDKQRLHDLQEALDDAETDLILCSRGGYGTVRIINNLDFSPFQKNPKWVAGFSDITILHAAIHNLGIASIHGAMPRYFFDKAGEPNQNLTSLMKLVTTGKSSYKTISDIHNKRGQAVGELVGGNLSIIASLQGTGYELQTEGKILFLEDIDEFLYHTDRMVHQLKLAGKLDKLAGLILGDFTDMKDKDSPFGKTVHEIITDAVKDCHYPVCFGFQGGHDKNNMALAFGKKAELSVTTGSSTLNFES